MGVWFVCGCGGVGVRIHPLTHMPCAAPRWSEMEQVMAKLEAAIEKNDDYELVNPRHHPAPCARACARAHINDDYELENP